ncbi:hypothetical protein SCP_0900800 [Sparassis crispa]|uniref:Uncharacterized protein n=1 Tax=Sparassis crispa TaxID=139825 RepID=A0A401GVE2_9APHY|nr:hypothetical protein SCP_0900800 [Sparassis crispa]GBE86201.1 hypothetical protein SCP_0900800 [Sparassis crispa]
MQLLTYSSSNAIVAAASDTLSTSVSLPTSHPIAQKNVATPSVDASMRYTLAEGEFDSEALPGSPPLLVLYRIRKRHIDRTVRR